MRLHGRVVARRHLLGGSFKKKPGRTNAMHRERCLVQLSATLVFSSMMRTVSGWQRLQQYFNCTQTQIVRHQSASSFNDNTDSKSIFVSPSATARRCAETSGPVRSISFEKGPSWPRASRSFGAPVQMLAFVKRRNHVACAQMALEDDMYCSSGNNCEPTHRTPPACPVQAHKSDRNR